MSREVVSVSLSFTSMCKTNAEKHRHTYSCVPTRTNVCERVWAIFWTIFDRTDMKISLYRVVFPTFRVDFDGDVRLFLAPPKSMFLSVSIDFCNFFVFRVFVKILILFFPCRRRAKIFVAAAAAAAATAILCVSFAHGCSLIEDSENKRD